MNPLFKKFIALIVIIGLNLQITGLAFAQAHMYSGSTSNAGPGLGTNELANPKDSCKLDFLNKGVTKLKTLLGKKETKKAAEGVGKKLEVTADYKGFGAQAVDVNHPGFTDSVILLEQISGTSQQTATDTEKLRSKAFCLDGLATVLIRTVLQQVTKSIVEWINNGFKGPDGEKYPLFIADSRSYFNTIAQAEISAFGFELKNSKNPYARSFFAGLGEALQTRFEDNARYSFNEIMSGGVSGAGIGLTLADFQRDFTIGGWDAWLVLTQVPYNNPVGAEIEFNAEIGRRLRGIYQTNLQQAQAELVSNGGFLGDKRCIGANGKPTGVTQQAHWRDPAKNPCQSGVFNYVTPGQFIASQANLANSSVLRQFEMADSLTDSMAAIADALLNQLFKTMTKGLFDGGADVPLITVDPNLFPSPPSIGNSFIPPLYQNGNWFLAHPDFDITQGISQAILDDQRTFKDKLETQNKILPDLVKWIHQLDYCIPGPNPDWETIADDNMGKILEATPPIETWIGQNGDKIGGGMALVGTALSFIKQIGPWSAIIGSVSGALFSFASAAIDEQMTKEIGAQYLGGLLDVGILPGNGINTSGGINTVLEIVLDNYKKTINNVYSPKPTNAYMPTVTPEARTEWGNLLGYEEILADNQEEISVMTNVVKNLTTLKNEVDTTINDFNSGNISQATFESNMKIHGAEFARLTNQMITGDDIATMDDFTKQLADKTAYVKDYLVGTPTTTGCEHELMQLPANTRDKYARRQAYPLPIDHAYSSPPQLGFLYYSDYFSQWGGTAGSCSSDPNYIGLSITVPSSDATSKTLVVDIQHAGGSINPSGLSSLFSGGWSSNPNNCGVINRSLEKLIGVY